MSDDYIPRNPTCLSLVGKPLITYSGLRTEMHGRNVTRNGFFFGPEQSFEVRRHSPDGFEWGYCGSGPAQLALALLLDCLGRDLAELWYQRFKREVVAKFDPRGWLITSREIGEWLMKQLDKEIDLMKP